MATQISNLNAWIDTLDDIEVQAFDTFAALHIGPLRIYPANNEEPIADLLTIAEIGDRIAELAKAKAAELANAAAATVEAGA